MLSNNLSLHDLINWDWKTFNIKQQGFDYIDTIRWEQNLKSIKLNIGTIFFLELHCSKICLIINDFRIIDSVFYYNLYSIKCYI